MSNRTLIAACLALLATGCAVEPDRSLLDIAEVSPERLEADGRLKVRGSGFPLGRTADIWLTGQLHRPGATPLAVRSHSDGEVESEGLVTIDVTDAWLAELGGRGTFVGHLRVGFTTARGALIFGEQPVRFDILPATKEQLERRTESIERARLLAQSLGLDLSPGGFGELGLEVLGVAPGSFAARAGIRPGDRIIALDRVRLYALADFLPPEDSSRAALRVQRPATPGTFVVRAELGTRATFERSQAKNLLLVLLGALIGLFGPLAALIRRMPAPRRSRPSLIRQQRASAWLERMVTIMLAALIGLGAAHAELPKLGWWILAFALVWALLRFAQRRHALESPEPSWGYAILVLVGMIMVGGSFDIVSIVERQGGAPWQWWVFRHPGAFLLCLVAVFTLRSNGDDDADAHFRSIQLAYRSVMAFLLVTLFLGGWTGFGEGSGAVGGAAFIGKLILAVSAAASLRIDERIIGWLAGMGLFLAALTFWISDLQVLTELAVPVLLGLLIGALAHGALNHRRAKQPLVLARWQL